MRCVCFTLHTSTVYVRHASCACPVCVCRVVYAPMHWYDETPSGRVMSRFTSDLNAVDQQLSHTIDNSLQMTFMSLILVFFVASNSWILCAEFDSIPKLG